MFYEEFCKNNDLIYLNSANLSRTPLSVLSAMNRYHVEFEKNPTKALSDAWPMLWNAQLALSFFLNADPGDLFLRSNVTTTLNDFLLGMPLPPNCEILIGDLEYGAIVNICRMRAKRDNLKIRFIKMPVTPVKLSHYTEELFLHDIKDQISPHTRLIVLSHIIAGNGMKVPIEKLALITKSKEILLVIDGAYAPGAIDVDLSNSNVDFYGCSLYKWMMGPKGAAFGWIAKQHQSQITPLSAGWTTYDFQGPIKNYGDGSDFQRKMLMSGCRDFAPFSAIDETILFWKRHGLQKIRNTMFELNKYLHNKMQNELPHWIPLIPVRELEGPMCLFQVPSRIDGNSLALRLFSAGVQANAVSLRGIWYLVLSPHIYNTNDEIDEAIDRIARLI